MKMKPNKNQKVNMNRIDINHPANSNPIPAPTDPATMCPMPRNPKKPNITFNHIGTAPLLVDAEIEKEEGAAICRTPHFGHISAAM